MEVNKRVTSWQRSSYVMFWVGWLCSGGLVVVILQSLLFFLRKRPLTLPFETVPVLNFNINVEETVSLSVTVTKSLHWSVKGQFCHLLGRVIFPAVRNNVWDLSLPLTNRDKRVDSLARKRLHCFIKIWHGKLTRWVLFHHNNALVHKSPVALPSWTRPTLTYLPDFVVVSYYIFHKTKKQLSRCYFDIDEQWATFCQRLKGVLCAPQVLD